MNKFLIKKQNLLYLMLLLLIIPVLFFLINFDREINLDYNNYKNNFENNWNQFEYGFELLTKFISYFTSNFDYIWTTIIIIEIFLIVLLFNNSKLMIFALPNLLYLANTLGTQIRFSLAVLIFLNIFKLFFNKKKFFILSILAIIFHNANIILILLSNYLKIFYNTDKRLNFTLKNTFNILIFITILLIVIYFTSTLLLSFNYHYYVGTKYEVGRSLSGIIFLVVELFFLTFIIRNKTNFNNYFKYIYLGFFLILLALLMNNYSVISGRITNIYLLVQPFIFYYFYEVSKNNKNLIIIFTIYFILNLVKVISKFLI